MNRKIILIAFLSLLLISCKKDDSPTTPIPDQPGAQRAIPWPSLANSPWPMGSHDPQATGRSSHVAAPIGAVQRFVAGKRITSCPVIGEDGTIYYQCDDSVLVYALYALNPDGTLKWKVGLDSLNDHGYWKTYSRTIVGSDGTIYTNSLDHAVYAINPNGTVRWMFTSPEGFLAENMTIGMDGCLYAISLNKTLYAIDPNGQKRWSVAAGFNYYQNLVFSPDGTTLYLRGDPGGLYAVSTSGATQWYLPGGVQTGIPLLVNNSGDVYAAFRDSLVCISNVGQRRWSVSFGQWVNSAVIDWNGNVSFATQRHDSTGYWYYLCSVDSGGTLRWINRMNYGGSIAAVCDGENTVFAGEAFDGDYFAFRQNGSTKWMLTFAPPIDVSSSPAITADGSLLLPSGSTTTTEVQGLAIVQ